VRRVTLGVVARVGVTNLTDGPLFTAYV